MLEGRETRNKEAENSCNHVMRQMMDRTVTMAHFGNRFQCIRGDINTMAITSNDWKQLSTTVLPRVEG